MKQQISIGFNQTNYCNKKENKTSTKTKRYETSVNVNCILYFCQALVTLKTLL